MANIIKKSLTRRVEAENKTAKFIVNMISELSYKNMCRERAILLLDHFQKDIKMLVGALKQVDAMDTIKNIIGKLLKNIPSFIGNDKCSMQRAITYWWNITQL